MKSTMMMSAILNMMFAQSKQPMNMVIIIILQTILTTKMINLQTNSPWFPYLLLIIFIGGMMVLFIYITSIAPNEKNKMNTMNIFMMVAIMIIIMMVYMNEQFNNNETLVKMMSSTHHYQTMLNMIFNKPTYSMSIMMMMIYLFIVMIAVNKISNMEKGPMRKKY